jgi:putative thioredoxin
VLRRIENPAKAAIYPASARFRSSCHSAVGAFTTVENHQGTGKHIDSGAAFRFETLGTRSPQMTQEFQIGGAGRGMEPSSPERARKDVTILEGNGATPPPAGDLIKDTTTQTFVKDVIEESKRQPVLIDFWAPWCGPCRQLTPILEKAVRAAKGKVKLVKMNIDEHPQIPGQMGIQSIPAVIAFAGGRPADGFMGAVPESQVTAFIDKLTKGMPGPASVGDMLKEAEAAIAEGDHSTAAAIYAEVLQDDSTNIAALAGLARCYIETGAVDQAKQTLAMIPEGKRNEAAVKAVQAAIDLSEQAKSLGPVTELEQKIAANPLDHQARFDLAVALNAKGDRLNAANHLLDIVKRDRKWNDDGARKQLVQFFEAWGGADEATVEGRKRLSSILFS